MPSTLTHFIVFVEEYVLNSEVDSSSFFALGCLRVRRKLCTGVLTNCKAFMLSHRPPLFKSLAYNHGNDYIREIPTSIGRLSWKMARLSALHYVTPKYVVLSDKRLGLIYYLLVILILIFTVFELFLWKGYLDVSLVDEFVWMCVWIAT